MKKIMAFGDSNVAGAELLDHLIPGFPGSMTFTESVSNIGKERLKWYMDNGPARYQMMSTQALLDEMRELTFTGELKKHLSVPVENHGIGGSSMLRIKLDLFREVTAELNRGTKPEDLLIVFSNTSFDRFLHCNHGHHQNLVIGKNPTPYGKMDVLDEILMRNWDDAFMMHLHFSSLLACVDFIKAINSQFIFFDSSFWHQQVTILESFKNAPLNVLFKEFMNQAGMHAPHDLMTIYKNSQKNNVEKPINPGKHFTHDAHVSFGKEFAQYIKLHFPDFA